MTSDVATQSHLGPRAESGPALGSLIDCGPTFCSPRFTAIAFVLAVVGVGLRILPPTFTVDVVANLAFGVPVILLPLVYFWTGKGEHRPRLERAAELTLIYLPYTAGSQLGYETIFLIGHPFNLWTPTTDPGWKWLWWQWGLTDTRYTSANNWIFGLELVGVFTGATLFVLWTRLIRPGLPTESRIRCLWLAFAGCAILLSRHRRVLLGRSAGRVRRHRGRVRFLVQVPRRERALHDLAALCALRDLPADRLPDQASRRAGATKGTGMKQLSGRRVLVTGASGVVAFPVAAELAKSNEVFAVARFSDPEQKRMLEEAGAHPIAFDLADPDLSPLPESVDVVINYAVLPPQPKSL